MVRPNQDLQRKSKSTEKLPGAKSITKNYLMKQLVKNLPKDVHGWAGQSWARVQSVWILVPIKKLEKFLRLEVETINSNKIVENF